MFSRDVRLTVPQDALCGAVSGVVARTLTAPLDVTKVLFQVGTPLANTHAHLGGGTYRLAKAVTLMDGYRGLFRGNLTSCLKQFPATCIQFATYVSLKTLFAGETGQMTLGQTALASAAAGYTATIITYPMDTIKTRLIAQPLGQNARLYKGTISCCRSMWYKEGPRSLWKGLSAALLATIPSTVALFVCYEFIERRLTLDSLASLWNESVLEGKRLTHGITAALVSLVCTHPLDTCRKKMQAYSAVHACRGGVDFHITGLSQCYRHVWRTQWWLGLYAGFAPAVFKLLLFNVVLLYSYMGCKALCLRHNGLGGAGLTVYPSDIEDMEYAIADPSSALDAPTVQHVQTYIREQEHLREGARHSRLPWLAKNVLGRTRRKQRAEETEE